jgi:hypothetical protein
MILHKQTAITFMLTLFWVPSSYALGLGVSIGTGAEDWNNDRKHTDDREISNYGFVLDTAVAKDRLFNYRFSLQFDKNHAKDRGLDMEGLATTHDFAFGVVRNQNVRLWLGPQLRVAYYRDLSPHTVTDVEYAGSALSIGVGPVIGLNVHLQKLVTFSASASYMMIGRYAGDYGIDVVNTSGRVGNNDVDADFSGLYASISIIFRINDQY